MSQFHLSPAAAQRIRTLLAGEPPGTVLRVAVEGGGCSGFRYRFALDRAAEDDTLIAEGGAVVAIDAQSGPLLAGAVLDYTEALIGARFAVRNPLARSSCGCGASFSPE